MYAIRIPSRLAGASLLGLALLGGACDTDPGQTALRISAYGEDFVEDRIPADVLIDGWSIEFSRFLVALSDIEANGAALEGAFVVDLTQPSSGEGHLLDAVTLPAEGHPRLSFQVALVTEADAIAAAPDDLSQMIDQGLSLLVEGTATRGAESMHFSWGFSTRTRYVQCEGVADLSADPDPGSQLTIHADHLFYDDLDDDEPNVAFDLVASADADGDQEIDPEELRALDITGQARYQVGSREITDLWGYIESQTATVGHIDGEGHCQRSD